jgi:hypothetical protein
LANRGPVCGVTAGRDVIDLERHDVAAAKLAIDGEIEKSKVRIRPSACSFVRMDQTCFGRSGGFAPTTFPLFHGTRLETFTMVFKTSVMATSSVSEGGQFHPGNSLK